MWAIAASVRSRLRTAVPSASGDGLGTIILGGNGGSGTLNIGAAAGDPRRWGNPECGHGDHRHRFGYRSVQHERLSLLLYRNGLLSGDPVLITGSTQVINTDGFNILTAPTLYRFHDNFRWHSGVSIWPMVAWPVTSAPRRRRDQLILTDGGTLKYTEGVSTNRGFSLGNYHNGGTGGVIDASGTGAINFYNVDPVGFVTAGPPADFDRYQYDDNMLAAAIADYDPGTHVAHQVGPGKWILAGSPGSITNTYTVHHSPQRHPGIEWRLDRHDRHSSGGMTVGRFDGDNGTLAITGAAGSTARMASLRAAILAAGTLSVR